MKPTSDLSDKRNWRDYILGPSGALVAPVRAALVPWDPKELDPAAIEWRGVGEFEEIPVSDSEGLLLDFGVKTTGFLYFQSDGARDFGMEVQSGPDIRLVIFGDTIVYQSGCGYFLDATFRALRFLKIRGTGGAGIRVKTQVEFTAWRGDYQGHFLCSDDLLNKIWYAGAYTIQICTQPHELSGSYNKLLPRKYGDFPRHWRSPYGRHVIWDAPRRDREVWIGDMWPESHGLLYSFHAPEAIKSSLLAAAVNQYDDGLIPGSGISLQRFSEYCCWWLALLDRFHLMTADEAFLHDIRVYTTRAVDWLLGQLTENDGFLHINHRQTWAWTLSRRGVVTGSQAVAVAALEGSERVLRTLGDEQRADATRHAADRLRELIATKLWNDETGVFRDCMNPPDGEQRVSCDSNSLVPLFGISSEQQTKRCFQYLQENLWTPFGTRTIVPPEPEQEHNWAHNHNIWPFVVGLELEARFERGHGESAMQLLRSCWGNMIEHGAATFWEMVDGRNGDFVTHRPIADMQGPAWDAWDSMSHGWSAAPTYLLQAYILGIRPLTPGFATFLVQPWLADLDFAEGSVPTPHGRIDIRVWKDGAGKSRLHLKVPEGTCAKVVDSHGNGREYPSGTHEVNL